MAHKPPRKNTLPTPKSKVSIEVDETGNKPTLKRQRTEVVLPIRRLTRDKTSTVKSPFVATYAKRGKLSPKQQLYMHRIGICSKVS